jgi:hypothetical protein
MVLLNNLASKWSVSFGDIEVFLLPRDTHELKTDQAEWVREKTDMVYSLLEETPPDGVAFVQTVKHILKVTGLSTFTVVCSYH